jgi:neopullulanase
MRYVALRLLLTCVCVLASAGLAGAQPPTLSKVDPPSWWVGSSLNPVRLLLHGTNLAGARIEPQGAGLSIGATRASASGTYLFVDVQVDPTAQPGRRTLRLTTTSGATTTFFDVLPPLDRRGRFQGFTPDDVIYLLMPDRFADADPTNNDPATSPGLFDRKRPRYYHGGDLRGVIRKLPYLKDLGVTALWLNPWYDNVNHLNEKERYDNLPITDYHGYGAVDFYGVEEHLGTIADLQQLVDEAHRLGMKVIQDQVANHSGPYHPWVSDQPTPTWFNGTASKHLANTWQIWTLQDPYATPAMRVATLSGWFIDILPDLNQDDDDAARYIIQNSLWWVGRLGLDGIRQDTWPYVPRAFWQRWMEALKREWPSLTAVGELYDADPALVSFFSGGVSRDDGIDTKVDSLFDFPLFFTIRKAFAEGKPMREVAQMLARDHLYPDPMRLVTFLGNHDMLRFMSESGATTAGLKLAQTFVLTTRGIPQLFYGDEIGLPGGGDPDNRRSIPGAFSGDTRDAFTASGRTTEEEDVFRHVRRVVHLRQELAPLRRGALKQLHVSDQQYVYARTTPAAAVLVAINNDTRPATIVVDVTDVPVGDGVVLQDRLGGVQNVRVQQGHVTISLAARTAAIFAE